MLKLQNKKAELFLTGGIKYTENGCDKGNFVRPTLITNVKNTCRVSQEEIFGPVAVVIKFKTDDEVIASSLNTGTPIFSPSCESCSTAAGRTKSHAARQRDRKSVV